MAIVVLKLKINAVLLITSAARLITVVVIATRVSMVNVPIHLENPVRVSLLS
jgi:hypothetical protein